MPLVMSAHCRVFNVGNCVGVECGSMHVTTLQRYMYFLTATVRLRHVCLKLFYSAKYAQMLRA